MREIKVTLEGLSPLLMHKDDPGFADRMKAWQINPENKGLSKAGDDRTPAWTWIGGVYHDATHLGIPSDNLMTMLREGGSKVETGKGKETWKRATQSGLIILDPLWPVTLPDGRTISWTTVKALFESMDFEHHVEVAQSLGFELLVKRARVGQAKHIRVRAQIPAGWTVSGVIAVTDERITDHALKDIIGCAGRYCGLLDWRPSSPRSPGPFGRFEAVIGK